MSANLYNTLQDKLQRMLDSSDLDEAARQISAKLAEEQIQIYSEKKKAKVVCDKLKSEFAKVKTKV